MSQSQGTPDQEIIKNLAASLKDESDRAVAVIAVAYLEDLLERTLSFVLRFDTAHEIIPHLLFKGPDASLGSFSAKIDAAHRVNIVNDEQKRDLHLIRKIRNEFAHELENMTFERPSVVSRCRELETAKIDGQPSTPREMYEKAFFRLSLEILPKTGRDPDSDK